MRNLKKHGISEAKKTPFKVALETEAFLASESTLISENFSYRRIGSGKFVLTLSRQRGPELLTRAGGFAAAQFES